MNLVTAPWRNLYAQARSNGQGAAFFEKLLDGLHLTIAISEADRARIPRAGKVIVAANHPFGMLEGAVLGALLPRLRPDVRILANSMLARVPEVRDLLILVDPFGTPDAARRNQRGLREAIEWLDRGGMLVAFPAGEVAHFQLRHGAVMETPWNRNIARLARRTGACVLPVYFPGANSALFHLAGMIHPRMRTAMLPLELLNKQKRRIEVRTGAPIPAAQLDRFASDDELSEHLRRRTCLLEHRGREAPDGRHGRYRAPVVESSGTGTLEAELRALAPESRLLESGPYDVRIARADAIPSLLREIGRLREVTFRAQGEGTGQPIDLDSFDRHYLHLFIWNRDARELVGAYRLGPTGEILERRGPGGLYTSTLFRFDKEFFRRIGPAIEMGRSFVRQEYQKGYAPLLLLWKGIGRYLSAHPEYRVLFGPVSVSNDYQPASRQLIVDFFTVESRFHPLAGFVSPRKPFHPPVKGRHWPGVRPLDLDELDTLIADVEPCEKGVPVLLRQYAKLGGQILGFHVDEKFSHTMDGLIVVDLARANKRLLQRYGCEAAGAASAILAR